MEKDLLQRKPLSLTEKVGWLTIGKFIGRGMLLIVGIIVARTFTKDTFGTYQQVFLFSLISSQLLISGIGGSAIYFLSTTDQTKRLQYITNIIYLLGVCGIIISLTTYFAAGAIASLIKNPGLKELLQLYSPRPVTDFLCCIFGAVMITENRVKEIPIAGVSFSFLYFGGYAIALWLAPTPKGLIIVNVALGGMNLGYVIWRCWSVLCELPIKFNRGVFKEQRGYIGAMLFQDAAGKIGYEADKLTVTYFMSPARYAVYVIGAKEIPFLQSFTQSVNALLISEISRLWEQGKKSEILELWRRAVSKTALVYIPIFIFLIVYAEEFLTLLYSDKYTESVILFQIYLVLIPLRSASYGLIFQAIGKMKYIIRATYIFFVFNIITNVVLIKVMGLPGPALATVLGTYIIAIYYIFSLRSFFDSTLLEIFPFVQLGRVFLMTLPAIAVSIATYIICDGNQPQFVRFLTAGIAFTIIYVLTAFRFDHHAKSLVMKFLNRLGVQYG